VHFSPDEISPVEVIEMNSWQGSDVVHNTISFTPLPLNPWSGDVSSGAWLPSRKPLPDPWDRVAPKIISSGPQQKPNTEWHPPDLCISINVACYEIINEFKSSRTPICQSTASKRRSSFLGAPRTNCYSRDKFSRFQALRRIRF